ncbi:homoserine kinase [Permianibacter aggregans]|uniref:Homoserine kinase n=1 Tax=Permianibacter aggregans TaxID=1510150 RepID=A0A4R6UH39_9GAMM|nr:homoserine kinase [Permianibacter aggregans]QGX39061.1 homoserine kinase [Permianibacter aggregans]TDQ44599.1 homoserine kinase [Permianibacter aggregans]
MSTTAFAPISSGNFIIGFDILGAAMKPVVGEPLGDWVSVESAPENSLQITGPFREQLPADPKQNIVWQCLHYYTEKLLQHGGKPRAVQLTLHKALPVGSGLGSSAASVVAAIKALNLLYDNALSNNELLILAGELEGQISGSIHYDNVAPSLLGGLQLMSHGEQKALALPTPPWHYVLLHPGTQLATKEARAVLPKTIPLKQTTDVAMRLAGFVHHLHQSQFAEAAALLDDTLIEPHRAPLIPHFAEALQIAKANGALAYSISGAGPTSLAVCESRASAEKVQRALLQVYPGSEVKSWICVIDQTGARQSEIPGR